MKKIIFGSMLAFALLSTSAVTAQNTNKDTKAKTECPKDKKDCKKECTAEQKATCDKAKTDKKGCCTADKKKK